MIKNFSNIIQVNDLDDFIGPGTECIKPIPTSSKNKTSTGASKIRISTETDNQAEANNNKIEKVQISLDDCLACSGCVTSAETVLINQQSIDELLKIIESNSKLDKNDQNYKLICISISPQSQASLAVRHDMNVKSCTRKLSKFFRQSLNAQFVFDTSSGREMSIRESQKEFIEQYQNKKLPLLASSCPGWICYAEKTHGFLLPHISSVKSSQQIMGSIIKDYICQKMGDSFNANNIFRKLLLNLYLFRLFDRKLI
jgi:iron only hydrogenase large subunit-like protein